MNQHHVFWLKSMLVSVCPLKLTRLLVPLLSVQYLVSDNRHFLRELKTEAFRVLSAAEFNTRSKDGLL